MNTPEQRSAQIVAKPVRAMWAKPTMTTARIATVTENGNITFNPSDLIYQAS